MLTAKDLRTVVATAVTAPSVHDVQPWRFAATPAGLEVTTGLTRGLLRQNLDGRVVLLEFGAATLHASSSRMARVGVERIAALASGGLGCTVVYEA